MKTYLKKLLLIFPLLVSCEDFLDLSPPKNQLVGEHVFEEAATVDGVFAHIYTGLRESAFTAGTGSGISYALGHYADELDHLSENQPVTRNFYNNSVLPGDSSVDGLWNSSYKLIYDCNSILEGVENSSSLSQMEKDRFMGEAFFLRAFLHFYLVNLFGDIPYVDNTDYRANLKLSGMERDAVYERILEDARKARELLANQGSLGNQFRPDQWTATTFLARVYLYMENWESAREEAEYVISEGPFLLEEELESVFLKDSQETLWHLGAGAPGENTEEGNTFIAFNAPPRYTALSNALLDSFEAGDGRYVHWVGSISDDSQTWYFPFKYRYNGLTDETMEYSILFRLAEPYLISAEAHAQLGALVEGSYYVNKVRERADLPPLPMMERDDLLGAIYHERRIEFFSEQGHRFFDLKRTGRANGILSMTKPYWDGTDILLPLPENELLKNPNLLPQNEGY
ncbi:RagB/SusD family nutrient uptake outer membrane protein [Muricauda oceani]|uniref:RagB/SusD family nutrient uptake outer membrane protein n=1 Tax=Flagellimonas oceani TaxID=2698672 RepID=A0A6G7J2L0_9FLAO|nr:RagB/SusD family nutrient uptake outer membrane protein [Allomuricauda oceani]MBW8244072.1 RagB/SusD family nutrient uptake outer membrane protein [Allomuricauda oceani]QII45045.1 RagB/SusD family nutrient uptake outer membrane protein [Allomuricauda oceani]